MFCLVRVKLLLTFVPLENMWSYLCRRNYWTLLFSHWTCELCGEFVCKTIFHYISLDVWLSDFVKSFSSRLMRWALMVFVMRWHKTHNVKREEFLMWSMLFISILSMKMLRWRFDATMSSFLLCYFEWNKESVNLRLILTLGEHFKIVNTIIIICCNRKHRNWILNITSCCYDCSLTRLWGECNKW